MKRTFKQFIYGLFYIAIFGGLVFGFYSLYIKPAPSCFNGVQDQNEQGIDCGGVCTKICLPSNLSQVETVGLTQIFHPTTSSISVIAQVQNKNADVAVQDLPYKFVFYDNQGNVLHEVDGDSFIYASEIKYIAAFNLSYPDAFQIVNVGFQVGATNWISKSLLAKPELVIQSFNTTSSAKGVTVSGNFINNSTVPVGKVTVLAIFYGKLGQPIGISGSEVDDAAPGQQYSFLVSHPSLANIINPSGTQVYLYGN